MKSDQLPHASKRRPRMHIDRDIVLDMCLDLLDEIGLEGLTLRRLAARLDVKAAALYWYFEDRQDLINQLAAKMLDREFAPEKIMNIDLRRLRFGPCFATWLTRCVMV